MALSQVVSQGSAQDVFHFLQNMGEEERRETVNQKELYGITGTWVSNRS